VLISHPERRANILEALKRTNSKYAKPFEEGRMATFSVMGGNWEEYAEIVVGMVTADTLLAIEMLLTQILQQLRDGSASPTS
jgi:hypothetical protein